MHGLGFAGVVRRNYLEVIVVQLDRRGFAKGLGAAALTAPLTHAHAETGYPTGMTIKFVVGYPAGGATDIVGRVVAGQLATHWKVSTYVDNIPGSGGNLGFDRVAKGSTDGSQVLIISPNISTNQFLYSRLNYDPAKDFIPLSQVASVPNLLCVRKELPVNSVAELIAYAKANPGKLNYASSGVGTTIHLSGELFKKLAGVDMVHVPYRGSAPAIIDLVGGNVDLMFDNIPSIISQVRAGTVKPLGITTAKRSTLAPEFAPVGDTVPGYDVTSWFGVGVKAGTPQAVCDVIERDAQVICKEAFVKERFGSLLAEAVGSTRSAFSQYVIDERAKWGKLITDQKIKAE